MGFGELRPHITRLENAGLITPKSRSGRPRDVSTVDKLVTSFPIAGSPGFMEVIPGVKASFMTIIKGIGMGRVLEITMGLLETMFWLYALKVRQCFKKTV